MKNKYVKCYDKFNVELKEFDVVDVQTDGKNEIYKKKDGQLYFKPYGKECKVSTYFSNDMIKEDWKDILMEKIKDKPLKPPFVKPLSDH